MSEMVMVEQRTNGHDASSVWIREGGVRLEGHDCDARLMALRLGLRRHFGVRAVDAAAGDEELDRALATLHGHHHLAALAAAGEDAAVMPELAPPGLEPDIPVNAALVAAAREAVRTAISAAGRLLDGDQYSYAVCRPPGHHAGRDFIGGYCYLNNAAAAVQALRDGGLTPVGVLDLDLHYPNGTSELVERMGADATLHSLHTSPVTNVAAGTELPRAPRERAHAFAAAPDPVAYLAEVEASLTELAADLGRAGRLARLRHRRWRPARRLALRPRGLRRDRPPAGRHRPAGLRRAGGRLRARDAGPVQPRLRRRPARGGPGMSTTEEERTVSSARQAPADAALTDAERAVAAGLAPFRARLDEIDAQLVDLLGERFQICREVAVHKSEKGIEMMQPGRVEIVRARYLQHGAEVDLPSDFTAGFFDLMIDATCRAEDELMGRLAGEEAA